MRIRTVWNRSRAIVWLAARAAFLILLIGRDSDFGLDTASRVRRFVRGDEFNFVTWTLQAVEAKLGQNTLGEQAYLSEDARLQAVRDFFRLQEEIERTEGRIADLYVHLSEGEAETAVAPVREDLNRLRAQQADRQPLAEAVLQDQLAQILDDVDLAVGGVAVPPVAFRFTPLPLMVIVSPRDVIRQEAAIDLRPGYSVDDRERLESIVDSSLDVSTYVTTIGGIGTYPTMLAETSALNWAAEVAAHEWTHNFLTLRPLGLAYGESPEVRTINETVASIAGKEIGEMLVRRFYPDLAPPQETRGSPGAAAPAAPAFDFRSEMHLTRATADRLLAEGKVEEAELYMEERRQVFVDQGYAIRKLNQAYFAFHGAYADGGGANGEDPVGPLVVRLRELSPSLADFLRAAGGITSLDELRQALGS